MSLPIILDKSTFQSLSYNEMIMLNNYYLHNITPLIVMEILGDLKKEQLETGNISDKKVVQLSTKLFPYNSVVNEHYKELVKANLFGDIIKLDERPILGNSSLKQTKSGKKGQHIEVSQEEENLFRWREGNFLEVDKKLSTLWRTTTTDKEYFQNLKQNLRDEKPKGKKIRDLDELNLEVERRLGTPDLQYPLLMMIFQNYGIHPGDSSKILMFWNSVGKPPLVYFAPYAAFCLKVDLFYYIGLQFDLIGAKPTNRLDLQYLYYLPFTKIFSSNDKIHKRVVPYFLKKYQTFIIGSDLKKDFVAIEKYREGLDEVEKEKTKTKPPIIEDSITFQMWNKYFDYPPKFSLPDNKPKEWYIEKMKEFESATDLETGEYHGEEDFIVRKSIMSGTDPCPCGSGKMLKDCHLPKDYFKKNKKER